MGYLRDLNGRKLELESEKYMRLIRLLPSFTRALPRASNRTRATVRVGTRKKTRFL